MRRTLASLLFITTIALALPATAAPARQHNVQRTRVARTQDDSGPSPIVRFVQRLGKQLMDDVVKSPTQ
jgi:hypothetical protein